MCRLELDLDLRFVPPMEGNRAGITLTRSVTLPFPPMEGLGLCGRELDYPSDPPGLILNEVAWDVDRQVFMARSSVEIQDLEVAHIPDWIRDYLGRGWRVGSYRDAYGEPEGEDEGSAETVQEETVAEARQYETLHEHASSRRPRWFNRFFKALIRHMAETFDNEDVACAMDKTGRHFPMAHESRAKTTAAKKWGTIE